MASIERYRLEMEAHLPERDDNLLFKYHKQAAERAMKHSASKEAIEEAFMDIIDQNWKKCEKICRDTLDRVKTGIFPAENKVSSETYWSLVNRLNAEYNAEIGESLRSKMVCIRLEHLERRQDEDIKIVMEMMQNNTIKAVPETSEQHLEKELKLRMTWGRVIIFWKYWIDCRKKTIVLLDDILDIFRPKDEILKGKINQVTALLEWIESQEGFENFPLQFAHTVNNDFLCYKVLLTKLTAFLDLVTSREYLFAFGVESKDLFFNISTLQNNVSARQPEPGRRHSRTCQDKCSGRNTSALAVKIDNTKMIYQDISTALADTTNDLSMPCHEQLPGAATESETCRCSAFAICEDIIIREKKGLGKMTTLLACTSRPLLHLKDLFRKLLKESKEGRLNRAGIEGAISDLQKEKADMSTMLFESLQSFEKIFTEVKDATDQLRKEIEEWLPKRDESIAEIKQIIEKLNKTTKDVAITQTVSSSVGIAGGVTVVVGLCLAPFTGGASLIPTAIAGGLASGLGAATAIGASVTEIFIDKGQIEKAKACMAIDKLLSKEVTERIENLHQNLMLFLRYLPYDELESFISVMTDPQSAALLRIPPKSRFVAHIAINSVGLLGVGGKSVATPFARMAFKGTIHASKTILLGVAQGVAFVGVGLDIANLVLASVNLGKGAKSEIAAKLEDAVKQMEEERDTIKKLLR